MSEPDGPEDWRHETIRGLRADGWSWEGIARICNVTVPGAKLLAGEPDPFGRYAAGAETTGEQIREQAAYLAGSGRTFTAGGIAAVPSFTCPRCGMTSFSPDDIREGYCGHCHDWTGQR